MKNVATLKKLKGFLGESIANQDLKQIIDRGQSLQPHIRTFRQFPILETDYPDYHEDALGFINTSDSSTESKLRMRIVLDAFRLAHTQCQPSSPKASDDSADEEESAAANQPAAANQSEMTDEDEDDVESSLISKGKAEALIRSLKKDFSYISQLVERFESLQEGTIVGRVVDTCTEISSAFVAFLKRLKDHIKTTLDMFGLKGSLIFTKNLMKSSSYIDTPIRILGTLLIIMLFLTFTVAYPIYRLLKSPMSVAKWAAEEVDIEIPPELADP